MILTTQSLVDTLRERCNSAQSRILIASPFIGSLRDVRKVIGGAWMKDSVELKVLTDNEAGFIKEDTYDEFIAYGEVRSLKSLHAKVYIVDDWCLITSANLTGTAFSRRYEIGTEVDGQEFADSLELFNYWWESSTDIKAVNKPSSSMVGYHDGASFSPKNKLPGYTQRNLSHDKYQVVCDKYKEFAELYEAVTGRNTEMKDDGFTLYQEVDYLFNYLYHEHPDTPSKNLDGVIKQNKKERKAKIRKYFKLLKEFYPQDKQEWRLERTEIVQQILDLSKIDSITRDDVKEVLECLHCLHSYPINKTKFLNPQNNNLKDIRKYWKMLLHSETLDFQVFAEVNSHLNFFGKSSMQELVGWYWPDDYPIINKNSDNGMKFFGYDV